MGLAVVTVARGGLPVVDVSGIAPFVGLPVEEALNGRGIPITKVPGGGLPVMWVGGSFSEPDFAVDSCFGDATPAIWWDGPGSYEVGTVFTPKTNGMVHGVRYYANAERRNRSHTLKIWRMGGDHAILAQGVSSDEPTSPGQWLTHMFATPLNVSAGASYIASYDVSNDGYGYTNAFHDAAIDKPNVTYPPTAGCYGIGAGNFPGFNPLTAGHFVEPLFVPVGAVALPAGGGGGGGAPILLNITSEPVELPAAEPPTLHREIIEPPRPWLRRWYEALASTWRGLRTRAASW
jgi:Domain of unknown function (DUF4082)